MRTLLRERMSPPVEECGEHAMMSACGIEKSASGIERSGSGLERGGVEGAALRSLWLAEVTMSAVRSGE